MTAGRKLLTTKGLERLAGTDARRGRPNEPLYGSRKMAGCQKLSTDKGAMMSSIKAVNGRGESGFTVIDMLFVIALIGLLSTLAIPGLIGLAFAYWQLTVEWGWPAPLALVAVLFVLAPLLGALIERVLMRRVHG